jgi:putative two-component system response regulator
MTTTIAPPTPITPSLFIEPTAYAAPNLDKELRMSKIMIVDDEPVNVVVTRKYLSLAGYENFVTTTDAREAQALVEKEVPDVVLLDLMMPHVSGLDILAALRADQRWTELPIVILTASTDARIKSQALELGATEFLTKPVDLSDLTARVQNVLMVKQQRDLIQIRAHEFEAELLRRTAALAHSRLEVIHCLARAAEFRDDVTGQHVFRVGRYSRLIAEELGWQGECLNIFEQAAQLHDIGKIGIPDSILLKPGKLTPQEFEIMQKHTEYGKQITQTLPDHELNALAGHIKSGARLLEAKDSPILALAAIISMSHHEKWNGSGYPQGLAGEAIPIEGRITAVADVFDALSSKRPYKAALPVEQCFQILEDGRGAHFDPRVLDAFLRRRDEVVEFQRHYSDENVDQRD